MLSWLSCDFWYKRKLHFPTNNSAALNVSFLFRMYLNYKLPLTGLNHLLRKRMYHVYKRICLTHTAIESPLLLEIGGLNTLQTSSLTKTYVMIFSTWFQATWCKYMFLLSPGKNCTILMALYGCKVVIEKSLFQERCFFLSENNLTSFSVIVITYHR